MTVITRSYLSIAQHLERLADTIPLLALRLILAWEFGEAGWEKLHGMNWFGDISFPFPFNLLPPELSWHISTAFELVGAVALVLGLATRFFTVALMILTVVAIAAVHWPEQWHTLGQLLMGYRIVDDMGDGYGNYKLPLLYLVMFLPLLFQGAGRFSLDYCIRERFKK